LAYSLKQLSVCLVFFVYPFGSDIASGYKNNPVFFLFILLMQIGTALSGEPKNKRGKRKIVHCLKLLTKGRGKFGQFRLTNASFLSEADLALTFLFTFCVKTKSKRGYRSKPYRKAIMLYSTDN